MKQGDAGIQVLKRTISEVLSRQPETAIRFDSVKGAGGASAVLLPVGLDKGGSPGLIFNKRSQQVRQAGDLCFPGGSTEPAIDPWIARMLFLPFSPLTRWPHWRDWRRGRREERRKLALLLSTGLRESFEEIRLNPFAAQFLGPLPAQSLRLFRRIIHPMAVWVSEPQRFKTNWEVDRIVHVRFEDLLDSKRYCCYRVSYSDGVSRRTGLDFQEFSGFLHRGRRGDEILWGATFRITSVFMRLIFGFDPPDPSRLPVVEGRLDESYYTRNNH